MTRADLLFMTAPLHPSDIDLAKLRDFSPAAARFLERAPAEEGADLATRLRHARAAFFVAAAWREANGEDPLIVANDWSSFADRCVARAVEAVSQDLAEERGEVTAGGVPVARAILSLGKHGAGELNPSSDIDVLFVYGRDDVDDDREAHAYFQRWARRVRTLLADVGEGGFVFRVDADLRPEGTTGSLVNSVDALERYYERFGRTWERAALTRLNFAGGDREVFDDVAQRLRPFVYPRTSDPRSLDALFEMKNALGATVNDDDGFDLKRGEGGIREVEFIAQHHQLLHGGRRRLLQGGDTASLLQRLEQGGLLDARRKDALLNGYRALRRVEHALQYYEDRQTHLLTSRERDRLQALGISMLELDDHRARVHEIFLETFRAKDAPPSPRARWASAALEGRSGARRSSLLEALGFDGERASNVLRALSRRRGSPFSPLVRAQMPSLASRLLLHSADSADPDLALARLADFFAGFTHRALIERLADDERLVRQLTRVLAESATLARALSRQAALAPALIDDEARRPTPKRLRAALAGADLDDEEPSLVLMRRVTTLETCRAALAFLDGAGVRMTELRLSTIADAVVGRALDLAIHKVSKRHGRPQRAHMLVGALGRLGGGELGFFADLDLVFVHDAHGTSDGHKPLSAREWTAKVAQQVIWMISAPLGEGRCYEVDSRLRPSGAQGPLCTSRERFLEYHRTSASLWERQAACRFRAIAGDPLLGRRVTRGLRAAISHGEVDPAEIASMLGRIHAERGARRGEIDIKLGPGGQLDINFVAHRAMLSTQDPTAIRSRVVDALEVAARRGTISPQDAEQLTEDYEALAWLRERLALVDDRGPPRVGEDDPRLARIGRTIGRDASSIFAELTERTDRIRALCASLLAR